MKSTAKEEPRNEAVIEATGYFSGFNTKGNYDVQLKILFPETSLADALQFISGIGKTISLISQIKDQKQKLGKFNIYSIKIDKNANCLVVFKSNVDSAFLENFTNLTEEEAEITIKAKILEE